MSSILRAVSQSWASWHVAREASAPACQSASWRAQAMLWRAEPMEAEFLRRVANRVNPQTFVNFSGRFMVRLRAGEVRA